MRKRGARSGISVTLRVPARTCLLVAALTLGGGAAAQSPTPAAVDLAGVDLLRPDGSWTRMSLDGCEVRTTPWPDYGFDGRVDHEWRCGDAARAEALLRAFGRALTPAVLAPEPSERALPARYEHRAVAILGDGTRWVVSGPAWREDAQRAYELAEAWDTAFPEDEDGDASILSLWTPLEANDDHGAALRRVVVRAHGLSCRHEPRSYPAPAPIADLAERTRALREAHPDGRCELTQWRGCLRTGCEPALARAWTALLATLPPQCDLGCARLIEPPRRFDDADAAAEELRQRRAADPEAYE